METTQNIKLTSTELANLWTQYMNDSMAICVNKYILKNVEDKEIRAVCEYALGISQNHIQKTKEFLNQDKYPIPYGFTDEDVNLEAPRLFSDNFWLMYTHKMSIHGITGYGIALTTSTRKDVRDYYVQCNNDAMELYNKSNDVLLSKGLFVRPPYIPTPQQATFVEKQDFLTGWFGERRPLNGIEISNIIFNLKKSILRKSLILGFSQVAKSKQVRQFMTRGADIASKHIETFSSILHEDELPSPMSWESDVTDSTIAPFSDKLMMFHGGVLINAAIAYYGAGMAVCLRRDLAAQYARIISELIKLTEDAANIMIDNGWMEQPPLAVDRKALARV